MMSVSILLSLFSVSINNILIETVSAKGGALVSTNCESESDVRYNYDYDKETGDYSGVISSCSLDLYIGSLSKYGIINLGTENIVFESGEENEDGTVFLTFHGEKTGAYLVCPAYNNSTSLQNLSTCSSIVSGTHAFRTNANCSGISEVAGWDYSTSPSGLYFQSNWGTQCLYPIYVNLSSNSTYNGIRMRHAFGDDFTSDNLGIFQHSEMGFEAFGALWNGSIEDLNSGLYHSINDTMGDNSIAPWLVVNPFPLLDTNASSYNTTSLGRWTRMVYGGIAHEPTLGGTHAIFNDFWFLDNVQNGIHDVSLNGTPTNYQSYDRNYTVTVGFNIHNTTSQNISNGTKCSNATTSISNLSSNIPTPFGYLAGKANDTSNFTNNYSSELIFLIRVHENSDDNCLTLEPTIHNFHLNASVALNISIWNGNSFVHLLHSTTNHTCAEGGPEHSTNNLPPSNSQSRSRCDWVISDILIGGGKEPLFSYNNISTTSFSRGAPLYQINLSVVFDHEINETNAVGANSGTGSSPASYHYNWNSTQSGKIIVV